MKSELSTKIASDEATKLIESQINSIQNNQDKNFQFVDKEVKILTKNMDQFTKV